MRRSIDDATDDHPPGDSDKPVVFWAVRIEDDCDGCEDERVVVQVEEVGKPGTGLSAHLSVASAQRLVGALTSALKELGRSPTPG